MKGVHPWDVDKLLPPISSHCCPSRHFKDTSLCVSNNVGDLDAVNEGIPEYTPILLSEILLFIFKYHTVDVSLYASPPDSAGFCIRSLGVFVNIARSSAG